MSPGGPVSTVVRRANSKKWAEWPLVGAFAEFADAEREHQVYVLVEPGTEMGNAWPERTTPGADWFLVVQGAGERPLESSDAYPLSAQEVLDSLADADQKPALRAIREVVESGWATERLEEEFIDTLVPEDELEALLDPEGVADEMYAEFEPDDA